MELPIHSLSGEPLPLKTKVFINGKPVEMDVDTGAAVSLMSENQQKALFPNVPLRKSSLTFRTYTGENMNIRGEMNVEVKFESHTKTLSLVVVTGSGPTLVGRNWIPYTSWNCSISGENVIHHSSTDALESLLSRYSNVFNRELGCISPYRAKLIIKPEAEPKFHQPRSVSFKDAIGKELDRMESEGILHKVTHSDWAAPIVAVPKKDGTFRICGDYKVTVNPALQVDQYPLPKPEDPFETLAGGQKFTKLYLYQAYLQLRLEDESPKYLTINTHQGLYHFNHLPFGVASALALFQKTMDSILQGIPKVICYIDDILITGKNDKEHLETLEKVLQCLAKHGIRARQDKCRFMGDFVNFLGHRIDAEGKHALPDKLETVAPKNIQELRSFLGLLNYYRKFMPNLGSILRPLNELLQVGHKWKWSHDCSLAFQEDKNLLTASRVLAHYDPSLLMKMAADASAYGVGVVISHVYPDGSKKPIAFASRTLTSSELNYTQIEKKL